MLAEMPSSLFWEWLGYSEIEPFGEDRADLRAGIIASTIAEVNRDRKKHPQRYLPKDFMPRFEHREQSVDEMIRIAEKLTRAWGGTDKRDKGRLSQ